MSWDTYEGIEFWDARTWECRRPAMARLFNAVECAERATHIQQQSYTVSNAEALLEHHYSAKTRCVIDPQIVSQWENRGLRLFCREVGGVFWIAAGSQNAPGKMPVLLKLHKENYDDPFWAMRALQHFRQECEKIAREHFILLIVIVQPEGSVIDPCSRLLAEVTTLFPVNPSGIYLELDHYLQQGGKLSALTDSSLFSAYTGENADAAVEDFAGHQTVNVQGRWQSRGSSHFETVMNDRNSNAAFDRERFIHSEAGRKLARAMSMEFRYDSITDPELHKELYAQGMRLDIHDCHDERWLAVTRSGASSDRKLPLLVTLQEVGYINDHAAVSGLSNYDFYCKLAAKGEAIVIMFAMESIEGNELLTEIVGEALTLYPIDPSRIYITGHSHNGYYALEFARRHPELITAVAQLGNYPGIGRPGEVMQEVQFTDEMVEDLRRADIPVINLCGCCESGMLPLNCDAKDLRAGTKCGCAASLENRVISWQRRLRSCNCEECTAADVLATACSGNAVARMLGVPSDFSTTVIADGFEHYIADVRNRDQKVHLRLVGVENTPHAITPYMLTLAWNFMKRFSRNGITLEIREVPVENRF